MVQATKKEQAPVVNLPSVHSVSLLLQCINKANGKPNNCCSVVHAILCLLLWEKE